MTCRFRIFVRSFIRVKWYSQIERLDCEDGELETNIPLEPSGHLNLTRIENMWGIDRCIVSSVIPLIAPRLPSFSFDPSAFSCVFLFLLAGRSLENEEIRTYVTPPFVANRDRVPQGY